MRVVVHAETQRWQSGFSFAFSLIVHGSVLAWVALGPLVPKAGPANLYEQEIQPNANHLVWYNLRLPEISPTPERAERRQPRARIQSPRTLVAGAKDTPRPPQIVWIPAPALETPKIVPSPNIVALTHPARPVRDFTPADRPHPKLLAPALPEAPQLAAVPPKPVPLPPLARPQPRAFTPPPAERVKVSKPELAAAPELTLATIKEPAANVNSLLRVEPARRTFVPPVEARRAPLPQPAVLPDAPQVASKSIPPTQVVPLTEMARAVRQFRAPEVAPAAPARPVETLTDAPAVSSARAPDVALAIVGLLPKHPAEIPTPKASQDAGFSAGPKPQLVGESAAIEDNQLVVPSLLAHAAPQEPKALVASLEPPTSARNLLAAARAARLTNGPLPMTVGGSLPVAAPAGSRLSGRIVYEVAIQMPNVTSYSGSWIIWFAEREPVLGQMPNVHPPLALRKVDPKYVPAAADEKIEGKVRVAAVIHRDGHVDSVELLQHLDSRLDQSAEEAVAKWEFAPAMRDGAPVDVDAVFEIPFHLAPRAAR